MDADNRDDCNSSSCTSYRRAKNEVNRGTEAILGYRERRKFKILISENGGTKLFISGGQGNRYPPLTPGRASLYGYNHFMVFPEECCLQFCNLRVGFFTSASQIFASRHCRKTSLKPT